MRKLLMLGNTQFATCLHWFDDTPEWYVPFKSIDRREDLRLPRVISSCPEHSTRTAAVGTIPAA